MWEIVGSVVVLAGSCISSYAINKSCKCLRKKLGDSNKGTEKADRLFNELANIAQELGHLAFLANMILIWIYLSIS